MTSNSSRWRTLAASAALLCAASLPLSTQAGTITTGPGADDGGGLSVEDDGPSGPIYQRLAGLFTLSGAQTVQSVAGWMNWYVPGQLVFSLYSDAGGIPGNALFQATVDEAATPFDHPDWRGAEGLDWNVAGGNYWLVIAAVPGESAFGSMPAEGPVANPLAAYAVDYTYSNGFSPLIGDVEIGMQMSTASAVPEAGNAWLMSLGLATLALTARRRRSTPD